VDLVDLPFPAFWQAAALALVRPLASRLRLPPGNPNDA
jgi:hypothetical protein